MDNYTPDINDQNNDSDDNNNQNNNTNSSSDNNSANDNRYSGNPSQHPYWQNATGNKNNNNMYNSNGSNSNNNNNNNNNYNNRNNMYNNSMNNYNQNNNPYNTPRPAAKPKDNLALLSMIFGIASVVASMIYYIGIPLAITAIVLSILSRNRQGRFEGMAVAGLCIGIAGIALGLMFFATMLAMFSNPDMVNYMQEIYQQMGMQ